MIDDKSSKLDGVCQILCRLFVAVVLTSLLVIFVIRTLLDRNDGAVVTVLPSSENIEQMKQKALKGDQKSAGELFWSFYYEDNLPYEEILYWGGLASRLGDNDLAKKLSCQEDGLKHCKIK